MEYQLTASVTNICHMASVAIMAHQVRDSGLSRLEYSLTVAVTNMRNMANVVNRNASNSLLWHAPRGILHGLNGLNIR